MADQIVQ